MDKDEPINCEETLELKFKKVNLEDVKNEKKDLPLKPCIRCKSFVNYDTHTREECALYNHENFKSKYTMESEEEDEKEEDWRAKENWKYRGTYSFRTNDNRGKRQEKREKRKNRSLYFGVMQGNHESIQNNVFEWHQIPHEETKNSETSENINELIKFLNRDKKRTISIDGNI